MLKFVSNFVLLISNVMLNFMVNLALLLCCMQGQVGGCPAGQRLRSLLLPCRGEGDAAAAAAAAEV
jgi:hypothetical protein